MHANASMESVKPRFAVEKHLRELFSPEGKEASEPAAETELYSPTSEADTSQPEAMCVEPIVSNEAHVPLTPASSPAAVGPIQLPTSLEDALRKDLTKTNEERHDWIEQGGKPDREVIRGTYRRMADFVVSTTDPDATVMPDLWGGTSFGLPHPLVGNAI